jgi:hypothetical protein
MPEGPSLERVHSTLSTASYMSIEETKPTTTEEEAKPKKEKEPTSFALSNPGRLTPAQYR